MITRLEVKRQAFHATLGTVIAVLYWGEFLAVRGLIIGTLFTIFLSIMSKKGIPIPFLQPLIDMMQRDSERGGVHLKGAIFYMIGVTLAVIIYPKDIALASIMILAYGDSVSRIAGPYGYLKHPWNSMKFIEGIIIGGIAAFFTAWLFVPLIFALFASAAAMFIEGVDLEFNGKRIDDNLTIPLVAGAVMFVLSTI